MLKDLSVKRKDLNSVQHRSGHKQLKLKQPGNSNYVQKVQQRANMNADLVVNTNENRLKSPQEAQKTKIELKTPVNNPYSAENYSAKNI